MANAVLDASVILAFALGEPHDVDEDALLSGAVVSAVNLAEVIALLHKKGVEENDIEATLRDFNLTVVSFGQAEASIAGKLIPIARPLGIGLGDCACIATALGAGLPVWTADRDWLKLETTADIQLIR